MFVDMAQSTSDHIFVLVIFNQFLKHHFGSADLHISGGYDDHDWSLGRYDTGPRSKNLSIVRALMSPSRLCLPVTATFLTTAPQDHLHHHRDPHLQRYQ